jgi:dTDP-4-amino-4,6-dideoxygalactose transaminase
MMVPLLDPVRGNAPIAEELKAAASRVIRSGKYILGTEVEAFERACAALIGAKHAIFVSSGTDALIVSLMALGIGRGDKVAVPSFTFFATAGAVARVGATPIFVDILPDSFTMDPRGVDAICGFFSAIIPVHLFGQCADMEAFQAFSRNTGIPVIEDACQAIGASWEPCSMAGATGDLGCFSFFPSKNLGGFGDGGLVTTQDDELADRVRSLRVHGAKEAYFHEEVGGNFRGDALQAALLAVKLRHLSEYEAARKRHAFIYLSQVENPLITLPKVVRGHHVWNQFTVRVADGKRDALKSFLADRGIASAIYYPLPLHEQECFGQKHLVLPHSEGASRQCLSLPVAAELWDEEIKYVAKYLNEFRGQP